MSVIVPFNRRDFVLRPSVSVLPLPPRAAAEPALAVTARELGLDLGAVSWSGGITLVAAAGAGLLVTVQARADIPEQVEQVVLLSPTTSAISTPEEPGRVTLDLRIPRSQIIAAIARHRDGRLVGALAELRMSV